MNRFLPPALIILITLGATAQKHIYDQKHAIPPKYAYDSDSAYQAIIGSKESGLKESDLRDYAEGLAYYHESVLREGDVYFNWSEAEDYLDSLVKKISAQLSISRSFKVFLIRDDDVNASAQDNGIIYVYVGLLAEMKDESALVSVLAHEISHVTNGDMKNSALARSRQKGKPNIRKEITLCHGNQAFEERADLTGYEAATGLNYDISSDYHTYTKFESDYRWYKSQYSYQEAKWYIALDNVDKDKDIKPDSLEKYLMDHPENKARIATLNRFKASKNGTSKFSGNEAFFKALQQKARLEQVYHSFRQSSYKNCLRNAFYFHMQDQSNADYLYYITECLRRMIFINPNLKKKGFLTEDSKEKVFEPNKGILHNLTFISLDTTFISTFRNESPYGLNEKPFETYSDAFNYFYKKLAAANHPSRFLIAGLYELARGKSDKGMEYMNKHLQQADAEDKDVASSPARLSELQDNQTDVVFIESPDTYVKDGSRFRYSFIQSQKTFEDMNGPFKRLFRLRPGANARFIFTNEVEDITVHENYELLAGTLKRFKPVKEAEFENNARTSSLDENYWKSKEMNDPYDPEVLCRNKNLFYFEPRYFEFFESEDLRSFTWVKPYYYKHPVLGTFMYFEIAYFDPVKKRYLYFEQEYLERATEANMKKILEKFKTTLSAVYRN